MAAVTRPQQYSLNWAAIVVLAALLAAGCAGARPVFPPEPTPGTLFRSLYPVCISPRADWPLATLERLTNLYSDVEVPTLILIGAADVDAPNVAVNCGASVAALRRAGVPVDLKVYPGAGHAFDQTWAYHADLVADAMKTSLAFFGRHLGVSR